MSEKNNLVNVMLITASFVIIVAGMKTASDILVPILLSLFIATISAPPLLWLKNKGLPTFVALLIVIAVISGVGMLLVSLVGASLSQFQELLPTYQVKLNEFYVKIISFFDQQFGSSLELSDIPGILDPGAIASTLGKAVNQIGGVITNTLLIFLTVVFLLLEVSTLREKLNTIFATTSDSIDRLGHLKVNVQRYLTIKTGTSLATGVLVWILLRVFGVDFAILWALLAFLLNYVPNIGSIIAAFPAVLLTVLQFGPFTALWVAVGYIAINVIIGSIIEPRIAGRQLGLSALVVFLSLVFWGWVLGPVGMFLSIPLTMIARLIAESYDNTRWIAILMSDSSDNA